MAFVVEACKTFLMRIGALVACMCAWILPANVALGDDPVSRLIEFQFTPTKKAQVALWIEKPDGTYLKTVYMTEATARYGIGNRPGATQMNSGFHWSYGRREGALPIWAYKRASAPGASLFRRVIFQKRKSEGCSSNTGTPDSTKDNYYCIALSDNSKNVAVDITSCATTSNFDKGRYITAADVQNGYSEPYNTSADPSSAISRSLDLNSFYPPRRDVSKCSTTQKPCPDSEDLSAFAADAINVMPEIDLVSKGTPNDEPQRVLFSVPIDWPDGDYVAWLEVNTERDYNDTFNTDTLPNPAPADSDSYCSKPWDWWARNLGYPYRGQPSVAYKVQFSISSISAAGQNVTTADPVGYSNWNPPSLSTNPLSALDATITDDPVNKKGSGADRLYKTSGGWRLRAIVTNSEACKTNTPPASIQNFVLTKYPDRKNSHQWAHLSFTAPEDDSGSVFEYQIHISRTPIANQDDFIKAPNASTASLDPTALSIPTTAPAGATIEADLGALGAETKYYVSIRALDQCNAAGPIAMSEIQTDAIEFTTVPPCFIATAAYGSPFESHVNTLRAFRDRHLMTNALGRLFVEFYYQVSPPIADAIREHEFAKSCIRIVLTPLTALIEWLDT